MSHIVSRPRVQAITTTAASIVTNRPGRKAIIFSNQSTSNVWVSPLRSVSSTEGILVEASGGFVSANVKDDGNLPELEWHAVGAGSVNILIIEIIETQKNAAEP